MSEEDFIYSAITDDNVSAFDLNVIANTLASTDKLVRENKQLCEENGRLREKISSLRESALQIKKLYELELAKTGRIEAQLATYVSQCQELDQRCMDAENERVNTDLLLKERLADYHRQADLDKAQYRGLVSDLVRYCASEAVDSVVKWKDLRIHAAAVEKLDLAEELKASFHYSHPTAAKVLIRNSKRKKRPTFCDQECQTIESLTAVVPARDIATNTDEPYSERRHYDPPEVEKKTFCDKGTMHSPLSTITRSTCTSAFIKRVDVGVNFPEVTHKSVDEILRECTRLVPLLLSPISDIALPSHSYQPYQSVETQTDFIDSSECSAQNQSERLEKAQLVSCGTMTNLKNIRKRIDYLRKGDAATAVGIGASSFQQQYISLAEQLYAKKIKKEEHMSAHPDEAFGHMHPHLSTIWSLLGETIFTLMGNPGRRFDGQCCSVINEQLSTIRDMLEADGRRESELMSAMFSNVRDTFEAAARYGKQRREGFPVRLPTVPREQVQPDGCFPSDDCLSTLEDDFVGHCQMPDHIGERVANPTEHESNQDLVVSNDPIGLSATSLSLSCTTHETKELNHSNSTSTTTTIIVPRQEQQTPETFVPLAKRPKTDVARSKPTELDGIEAMPNDSQISTTNCNTSSSTCSEDDALAMEDEHDRIAQELRLMEEGEDDILNSPPMELSSDDEHRLGSQSIEDVLAGSPPTSPKRTSSVERIETSSCLSIEQLTVSPARPSTPPRSASNSSDSSSNTATFVSPIKVKETNELVKDQFKTPAQPPISKRKLRIRRPDESSAFYSPEKRQRLERESSESSDTPEDTGRLSPTTEFLLEDDWDSKLSSIKAAMFSRLDRTRRPLSPIADQFISEEIAGSDERREEVDFVVSSPVSSPCENTHSIPEEEDQHPTEWKNGSSIEREEPTEVTTIVEPVDVVDGVGLEDAESTLAGDDGEIIKDMSSAPDSRRRLDSPVLNIGDEAAPVKHCSVDSVGREGSTDCQSETRMADDSSEVGVTTCTDESNPAELPMEKAATNSIDTATEEGEIVDDDDDVNEGLCEKQKTNEVKSVADPIPLESPESPDWDSPMSPPAHETGTAGSVRETCDQESSVYSLDSPLSPTPADASDGGSSEPPRLIPLNHVNLYRNQQRMRGPIDLAIECYKLERRFEVVNTIVGRLNPQEQRSLQQLTSVLQHYLTSPWTDAVVADTIAQIIGIVRDGRMIAHSVLEATISHGDTIVNLECSPPAPPIPVTQQKLVLLVRQLTPHLSPEKFDRVMMRELDRRMFQLKNETTVSLPGLIALTFLYIGLEDSKPPLVTPWNRTYSVRLYLFKCLYYFGYKCLPLVYYVLRAFPFALPKKSSPNYDNADAMISTIRTILMNINYTEGGSNDVALYKKREMYGLLTFHYGYQPGSPSYEELVVNLIEKIRANRLRNVPHALILVAKRKGYLWASQHIIQKRLYPLLNDYLKLLDLMNSGAAGVTLPATAGSDAAGGLDERIVACIFTLSSIMKTHPATEDVSGVMQIFTTIVQLARGNQAIQEEAIAGLIKFSRFGHADIFERLNHWHPTYPVSDRIKLMLATLLHRKDLRFWKQLIQNRIV